MTKELFHAHIEKAMDEVADLCVKHGIRMLASFETPTPSEGGMTANYLVGKKPAGAGDDTAEYNQSHTAALAVIRGDAIAVPAVFLSLIEEVAKERLATKPEGVTLQ